VQQERVEVGRVEDEAAVEGGGAIDTAYAGKGVDRVAQARAGDRRSVRRADLTSGVDRGDEGLESGGVVTIVEVAPRDLVACVGAGRPPEQGGLLVEGVGFGQSRRSSAGVAAREKHL
jgi:hypothetical protein